MKIDLTSMYFNGETKSPGNTASWGTSLGQESPNYPISVEGGQELFDFINENSVRFDVDDPNCSVNIRGILDKKVLAAGKFESVLVNNIPVKSPFFLLVIEEKRGVHAGRKSLKYNNKLKIGHESNDSFYQEVGQILGEDACWFAHDISVVDRNLCITVVKVRSTPVMYESASDRKFHWNGFLDNFSDIKEYFHDYLLGERKIRSREAANQYVSTLSDVQDWLKEIGAVNSEYLIWDYMNNNDTIAAALEKSLKSLRDQKNE